jgi:hypothetical protein
MVVVILLGYCGSLTDPFPLDRELDGASPLQKRLRSAISQAATDIKTSMGYPVALLSGCPRHPIIVRAEQY